MTDNIVATQGINPIVIEEDDIAQRLRSYAGLPVFMPWTRELLLEAADDIEHMRVEGYEDLRYGQDLADLLLDAEGRNAELDAENDRLAELVLNLSRQNLAMQGRLAASRTPLADAMRRLLGGTRRIFVRYCLGVKV